MFFGGIKLKSWSSFGGTVRLSLVSPDVEGTLESISRAGITLFHVESVSELETRFSVEKNHMKSVRQICTMHNGQLHLRRRDGVYWTVKCLIYRPVLVLLVMLLLGLTLFLPSRVLFFDVEGNQKLTEGEILEVLYRCGIGFGSVRGEVRSEKIKNALLEELPQLQWAGINTVGCRAVVSVRERTSPASERTPKGVHNIVALCDGVVEEVVVTRGSAACRPGQSVRAGEVLISGYTDLGICIRGECAQGTVFARTKRSVQAFSPFFDSPVSEALHERTNYFFFFGKNRINFCKGSGISCISCDKIYTEKYLTLPGGYQLPLGIGVERLSPGKRTENNQNEEAVRSCLSNQTRDYLLGQMVSGKIVKKTESFSVSDSGVFLTGDYACHEMIGRLRLEEQLRVP